MEIRTVENGFPTPNVVPGGRARVTNAIATDDASIFTPFVFDDIPFLQSNVQYAFVLIPDGGNDEYLVWTAKLSDTDVTSKTPIYVNNQLGNMFISSNDLVWTPLTLENIKYNLYIANFRSSSAEVVMRPIPTDFVRVNEMIANFKNKEAVWISNTISNSQITWANVTADSTTMTIINSVSTGISTDGWIYVAAPDRTFINFRQATSVTTNVNTNITTVTLSSNATFTNTTCIYGTIAGNGYLTPTIKSQEQYFSEEDIEMVLIDTSANSVMNLADSANQYIFGLSTKASAVITAVANRPYDSITPHINFVAPAQTAIDFAYKGYANGDPIFITNRDTTYIDADDNVPNEFFDRERLLYSKSNELDNPSNIGANGSLLIKTRMSTSNSMTAPYIDRLGTMVTLTYNTTAAQTQLMGYHLNIKDLSGGYFKVGDTITQSANTVRGVVDDANSSYLRVKLVTGAFTNTAIINDENTVGANVTSATYFDETLENGYYNATRYISKNVVLADKQDAEDIICFLTVYRPVGTQFNVYGKFLNGSDSESFSSKDWSHMIEADATTPLFSSASNRDDLVEVQFGLPASVMVDNEDGITSATSANVTVADTTFYSSNTYIYLKDNTSPAFNVRKIKSIYANTNTLTLTSNVSFTSSNTVVGNIPGLQSQSGVFLYANNNGIIRYVTKSDVVYDSYKTFAIKIVPVTNNSVLVPIMRNMRSIALQI